MVNLSLLMNIPLFNMVREDSLERIFNELSIKESIFDKNDILALQDEQCNRLIILLNGSVKCEMTDPSGKIVKVEDIEAPNPLAILFLFGKDNKFPVQVTAREPVIALVIPQQSILKMLSMDETLLKNYLDISAGFASRLSKKLHFMSFRTIRQKMAMYMIDLSQKVQTDRVELDKTKSALAEYFGVSRQSLERELTKMQNDGLIEVDKKIIIIKDKAKLIRLVRF